MIQILKSSKRACDAVSVAAGSGVNFCTSRVSNVWNCTKGRFNEIFPRTGTKIHEVVSRINDTLSYVANRINAVWNRMFSGRRNPVNVQMRALMIRLTPLAEDDLTEAELTQAVGLYQKHLVNINKKPLNDEQKQNLRDRSAQTVLHEVLRNRRRALSRS